jgi:hypothetical protein
MDNLILIYNKIARSVRTCSGIFIGQDLFGFQFISRLKFFEFVGIHIYQTVFRNALLLYYGS